ncbi:MAG: Fe-S cluster assembly protein SufD [Gammaproteobacteria bacterium]|jgi:Fe-S cluster assembly protein SufD|nr:Fe-S cluster assembly protein SufD [Gammaproteobacteria bacterium]
MTRLSTDKLRAIIGRLPTTRDEDWKYTDLSRARDITSRWLDAGCETVAAEIDDDITRITSSIDATWFVIANGELRLPGDTPGVSAQRLDSAPVADSALAELNTALLLDGLRVRIEGTLEKPIGLLLIDGAADAATSQTYVEIEFAANSAGEVIEYHASLGATDHYANVIIDITVGDNAAANHVRIQDRDLSHVQTARTVVNVGRDARFSSTGFDLGGGLIRNDIVIDIAHPGAEISFDGLYLADEGQHIDNHTRVDHRAGPATSRQEYRGILNGKCRCVWNGKAIVHQGADGTDADQANHNLLLSEKAEIDAKPELEIYTDDVKCSHGTTVGQLDEASLFYLRTRGLDRQHAKRILTHAFAAGLVSRIPVESSREAVGKLVEARLAVVIQLDEDFS